ncbi:hypothetical protein IHE45_20G042900 [Dioscorea alata]|uniref:Uncharacterized protein n=1 Tax=Dioscorea alata TaxID=55571 RepID=A0ACB7TVZ3_DIOAL|nr:hypothetical protein IHE45_20G042900 [Dioscorea alata]
MWESRISQSEVGDGGAMAAGRNLARRNAMRSGLVVVGAIAFGYLSIQVGFKPFLERAQESMERSQPQPKLESDPSSQLSSDDGFVSSFSEEERL